MGIFDFFKKKNIEKESSQHNEGPFISKEKLDQLVASSLNILCDDVSSLENVEKYLRDQGYNENQVGIIAEKANEMYIKYFAHKRPKNNPYDKIKIYNEYIVNFIGLQLRGDYAPVAAYENENGGVQGFLYLVTDDSYTISAQEVIDKMEDRFENELKDGRIKSYIILYHSQFENNNNHKLALKEEDLKAVSILYHFKDSDKAKIGLPYVFENDEINYKGFSDFSQEQNNEIMNTQLVEGHDYFKDREEVKAPESENEIGIRMKKSNTGTLANTWGGVFGHERFQNSQISDYLIQLMALNKMDSPDEKEGLSFYQTSFEEITFKTILSEDFNTIYPEVNTDFVLNFETKEINEWENAADLEAVVAGAGRDTFGLWFFATDYAENRNVYAAKKDLNVKISGIAFVLDIHNDDTLSDGAKLGKDFTGYFPSKDLPNHACFDFIGLLEDFKETELLDDKSVKGFMLKLRLITNAEQADFFTIDVFVNKENMRFNDLTKGMKLTGALQLQGKIAE
ncbi:hypothetical protein M2347_000692 [Chryseobacterium sp. H1D6B]|uniref:hypothetical protein n=1 Tax=Chryseobacterium sp. H1D6B TaxID=2940588 RepID=UPI0015CA38D1|nr:hypothetical protein [Chryseobacterium sp. H1D6B]MDH6250965.1 hypothetical protein [Chryseobacterium sp. H1D6B]